MAVDPKYIEKVQDEDEKQASYDDIMKKFGVKGSFQENDSGVTLPTDYWERPLKSLEADEVFEGKPTLGNIEIIEFTDKDTGKSQKNIQAKLYIIDDDEKEAYVIPLNLKSKDNVQKNVHHQSSLYKLVMGLMELEAPGIHNNFNQLDKVDLKQVRKQLDEMENLMFKVVNIDNNGFIYKSFVIVDDY